MTSHIASDYRPAEDEPYMNPKHLLYYRNKIQHLLADVEGKLRDTRRELAEREIRSADLVDDSDLSVYREKSVRSFCEYRILVEKCKIALRRIEDGTYGYCQETGEEIGLKRLDTLPYTPLSVEAQQIREGHVH